MMTFDELKAKYPRLLRQTFGFECDVGWIPILDAYFAVVDSVMPEGGVYQLRQVKEKLGSLRIYDSSRGETAESVKAITEAHRLAEARSYYTCERCGKPGRWSNRDGVLLTVCEKHAVDPDFGRAVPIESGTYRCQDADGSWLRYDPDIDAFVATEAPK
ncbi:hypothetical protein [Agrobacterium genomosp. 2]|uniref:Uncharacterized protein n=1 Tax=Agrobacterium genomosp. 2 str. CFBP 5494 TaxID=1183436 RepID=A0A9W5F682_9HYPH|nr:hypothetical protein [Agrobacterium genomosp. 2]CUX03408.1 hypothetical protein AGR2A_pb10149 [Agrobacterium genomosp. 2 str. CFBP 5494]